MDSKLYEEFCRWYIADKFGVTVADITSRHVENPQSPGDPEFSHQIDHYWETGSDSAQYVHIANAKWRTSEKIDQGDVLLLQQVRTEIRAHKAILIASTGFTKGARAVASQHGIGLHVVCPAFDYSGFPTSDRAEMQEALAAVSGDMFAYEVVHRGFVQADHPVSPSSDPRPRSGYSTRQMSNYTNRSGPGSGAANRSLGGGSSTGSGGGYTTRASGGGGLPRGGSRGGFGGR